MTLTQGFVLICIALGMPVACAIVMIGAFVRGLIRGYRWKRDYKRFNRLYSR